MNTQGYSLCLVRVSCFCFLADNDTEPPDHTGVPRTTPTLYILQSNGPCPSAMVFRCNTASQWSFEPRSTLQTELLPSQGRRSRKWRSWNGFWGSNGRWSEEWSLRRKFYKLLKVMKIVYPRGSTGSSTAADQCPWQTPHYPAQHARTLNGSTIININLSGNWTWHCPECRQSCPRQDNNGVASKGYTRHSPDFQALLARWTRLDWTVILATKITFANHFKQLLLLQAEPARPASRTACRPLWPSWEAQLGLDPVVPLQRAARYGSRARI